MKNIKAISAWLFFLLIFKICPAQQYDKVWAVGQPVTTMTFDNDTIALNYIQDSLTTSFETIGDVCDQYGNFLFYSNGLAVFNRYGNVMPNGDSLNYPSEYYDQVDVSGMPSLEGVIILPKPNDTNQYYIFHYSPVDTLMAIGGYESLNLYYSVVDMRLDNGRGDLIEKNVPLIQDQLLSYSRMAACKHANGRDWWIVKNAWHENVYYTFLLTPGSLLGPFIQQIGPGYGTDNEQWGYSTFSQDGSKYASVCGGSLVVLMDFDRCSGLFSYIDSFYNNGSEDPINNPFPGGNSIAFSPGGRFLYIDNPIELNQYDLWSAQIHDSICIKVDSNIYQMNIMQLSSNGKIYISCYNGGSYEINVINQPDSFGLACNFQLLSQPVLSVNSLALPYFPNFRLGTLVGSGCDTITGITDAGDQQKAGAIIEPNPASSSYTIVISSNDVIEYKNLHFMLYDLTGQIVLDQGIKGKENLIHRTDQNDGIYLWQIADGDKKIYNGKLVLK